MLKETTREEHLQWCKDRALAYLDPGPHFSIEDAFASMASDLSKHDGTLGHVGVGLGFQLLMAGHLATAEAARKYINGFH